MTNATLTKEYAFEVYILIYICIYIIYILYIEINNFMH